MDAGGQGRRHPSRSCLGSIPKACEGFSSFKQPSAEELEHDFCGARRGRLPSAGGSASSIVPIRGSAGGSGCHRRFCASQGLADELARREKPLGEAAIAPSLTWRVTSIATERGSSKYSSHFQRRNNESASWSVLMSRRRTGNSAWRIFMRGNTGSIT